MSDRLKALREQRGRIVEEMRAITTAAETEKRDMTGEELAKHTALFDKTESLRQQIEAEQRQNELDRQMAATQAAADGKRENKKSGEDEPIEVRAFRKFLTRSNLTAEEARALQADSDTQGGYLIPPQQFVTQLIQAVDNAVFIRNRATKLVLAKSASLGVPSLDADPADADWTSEVATGNEDTAMKFGKRELTPKPLAKRIKVSKKLLRDSALPVENIVLNRLGYKFGVSEEKAYLLGDGANKPLGVFVASDAGIPTSRDVSTGNTTTAITFDGLTEAKFSVKSQYWPKADWLFHRDAIKQITKLKDGEGQYIWRMSVRDGEPDTLLGRPLMISEYAPNTFTSQLYVGLFGDFSHYWIVDALDMQIQRLTELYAESNQDGFIGRKETDGMPVLAEAFARVKLA